MAEYPGKLDTRKYKCEARMNCWLLRGEKYCAICGKGDQVAWRAGHDAKRVAEGMPTYAEVLVAAKKAFGVKE